MTTTREVEVWRSPDDVLREALDMIEEWREDARRRRRDRRIMRCAAAFIGVFAAFVAVIYTFNKDSGSVAAFESLPPATSTPLAAEFAPPATFPTPETMPPASAPGWTQVRVQLPGWDGLGKLLTDGEHAGRDNRVLPGSVGVAIVAVDTDPSLAATAVVEGVAWRVTERGKVPQHDISRFFRRPVEPVLVLISTLPGTDRAYVEGRR